MFRVFSPSVPSARFFAATLTLCALSGCAALQKLPFVRKSAPTPATVVVQTSPTPAPPPQIDYAKVRPNELGRIPVIMYHEIGGKVPKHDYGLQRPVEAFEKDLELLYAANFRPVNMADVLAGKIDVPAGTSPVVITFDDARATQFKLIETATEQKIDPQCGVGVLQAFHKKHPDWGLKATFFVLPKGPKNADAFGQVGMGDQKLQYLVDNGFEIGNHTINHPNMKHMTPEQIQAEVGGANKKLLEAVPKAKIVVVALPMGVYPKNKAYYKYLVSGASGGVPYSYAGAMLAAYRPMPSPFVKEFDPLRMERIAPMDKDPNGLRNWIVKLTAASGNRYVSDGDPETVSFPKSEAAQVNTAALTKAGLRSNAYVPFGGAGGAKPIVSAEGSDAGTDAPSLVNKPIAAP